MGDLWAVLRSAIARLNDLVRRQSAAERRLTALETQLRDAWGR